MESLPPEQCPMVQDRPCSSNLLLRKERGWCTCQLPHFFSEKSPKGLASVQVALELWLDWHSLTTWGRTDRGKVRQDVSFCVQYRMRRWGRADSLPYFWWENEWMGVAYQTDRQQFASFREEKELVEPSRREPALEGWPDWLIRTLYSVRSISENWEKFAYCLINKSQHKLREMKNYADKFWTSRKLNP